MYLLVEFISHADNKERTTEEIYKAKTISELKVIFNNLMNLYKFQGFNIEYNESLMATGYKDNELIRLQCFTSIW